MLGVLYGQITVPPPPPPPPSGFTDIATLVVASAGVVEMGVPMAQGLLTAVRSVRIDTSVTAQADNFHTDRSGWCRWFMLTTPSLAPGTYTLSGSTSIEAATTLVWSDVVPTSVSVNGNLFISTNASLMGYWRAGPCASEAVLLAESSAGQQLRTRFVIAKYAGGTSRTKVFVDNAYVSGGAGYGTHFDTNAPRQLLYNAEINRGADQKAYSNIIHPPHASWLRTLGNGTAHANLQPLVWSGTTNAGHAAYFCSSGMVQNFTGPFTSAATSVFLTSAGAFVSPADGDAYTPDKPFSKSVPYTVNAWVTNPDPGYQTGFIGPFNCRNTGGGDDVDIGAHPSYYLQALFNYDANHREFIEKTVERRAELNSRYWSKNSKRHLRTDGFDYIPIDNAVSVGQYVAGTCWTTVISDMAFTGGGVSIYSSVGGFTSVLVNNTIHFPTYEVYRVISSVTDANTIQVYTTVPASNANTAGYIGMPMYQQYWEQAHWGANFCLPYLLTGQYECMDGQIMQEFASWVWSDYVIGATISDVNHGAIRGGQYRHPYALYWDQYYDTDIASGFPQEREMGWAVRTTNHTAALMPDDEVRTSLLWGWDKSLVWERWANVQQGLYDCYVVGSSVRFPASVGARFNQSTFAGNSWMTGIILIALGQGITEELDVYTTAGNEYAKWMLAGQAELYSQTTYPIIREYLYGSFATPTTQNGQAITWLTTSVSAFPIKSWVSVYIADGSAGAGNWPDPTTANFSRAFITDTDWMGYRMDALVYAVESSAHPNATQAYEFMTSMCNHYTSTTFWYGRKHSLTIRT